MSSSYVAEHVKLPKQFLQEVINTSDWEWWAPEGSIGLQAYKLDFRENFYEGRTEPCEIEADVPWWRKP